MPRFQALNNVFADIKTRLIFGKIGRASSYTLNLPIYRFSRYNIRMKKFSYRIKKCNYRTFILNITAFFPYVKNAYNKYSRRDTPAYKFGGDYPAQTRGSLCGSARGKSAVHCVRFFPGTLPAQCRGRAFRIRAYARADKVRLSISPAFPL